MPDVLRRLAVYGIVPLALVSFTALTTPLTEHNGGLDSDGVFYAAAAAHPEVDASYAAIAPWCHRVLTPTLARALSAALGIDTLNAFRVLAFASSWLALAFLYALLQRGGVSQRFALLGLVWYAGLFWALKFAFFAPAYIDYQTQAFLLGSLLLIAYQRWWALPFVLAVGVLQKESLLFVAVVALVARGVDAQAWRRSPFLVWAAVLIVLPALALAAVRVAVPAGNVYSAPAAVVGALLRLLEPDVWPRLLLAVSSGLGMLPLLCLAAPRRALALLRSEPMWLALAVTGLLLLLGGADKSRLFLYAAPALVWTVSRLTQREVAGAAAVWLPLAVALGAHVYLGNLLEPIGSFEEYLDRHVPMHATGSLTPAALRAGICGGLWIAVWLATRSFGSGGDGGETVRTGTLGVEGRAP